MYEKRFFLLFKGFFFSSWNWIKPSDWIYSGQHSDWRIELVWAWPQQWLFHGPNRRWGSDLLTWICPDWKDVSGKVYPYIIYLSTLTETYSALWLAPIVEIGGMDIFCCWEPSVKQGEKKLSSVGHCHPGNNDFWLLLYNLASN